MNQQEIENQIKAISGNAPVLERLGEGGMSVVYKAGDTKRKRLVVIKLLPHLPLWRGSWQNGTCSSPR